MLLRYGDKDFKAALFSKNNIAFKIFYSLFDADQTHAVTFIKVSSGLSGDTSVVTDGQLIESGVLTQRYDGLCGIGVTGDIGKTLLDDRDKSIADRSVGTVSRLYSSFTGQKEKFE